MAFVVVPVSQPCPTHSPTFGVLLCCTLLVCVVAGNWWKSWKRRFFVLKKLQLFYYKR